MCLLVCTRIQQAHKNVLCPYITHNSICLFIKDDMLRDLRMKLLEQFQFRAKSDWNNEAQSIALGLKLTKPEPGLFEKSLLFLSSPRARSLSMSLSLSQPVIIFAWTFIVSLAICLLLCLYFLFTGDAYIPYSEHVSFGGREMEWFIQNNLFLSDFFPKILLAILKTPQLLQCREYKRKTLKSQPLNAKYCARFSIDILLTIL